MRGSPDTCDPKNIADAIKRFGIRYPVSGIRYPVAQDNRYDTWRAYGNQYWPALYRIDASGKVVYMRYGEGAYDKTEPAIRGALAQAGEGGKRPKQVTRSAGGKAIGK